MSKHFKRGGKVHHKHKEDGGGINEDSDTAERMKKANAPFNEPVTGKKSGGRLDKYARGGRAKKGGHTNVNVIVAPHGPHPAAGAAPAALPPGGPPMPPPGGGGPPMMPPPGGPPGGGLPPGLGKPPGMMNKGGRAYKNGGKVGMKAGSDSGVGRLEKVKAYGKAAKKK
jgi:hypothetical protein